MSFALAFEELFASIFRSPHKPRLRLTDGRWVCEGAGQLAQGDTPMRAYANWWKAFP